MSIGFRGFSSYGSGSSFYGGMNYSDIYSLAGNYRTAKSSSYRTALKSYLKSQNTASSSKTSPNLSDYSTLINNTPSSGYANVKSDTTALSKSARALSSLGSSSVFKKTETEVTDSETGEKKTVKDYDKKKIMSALKSYVSDYNAVIDSVNNTENYNVVAKANTMVSKTNSKANELAEIGITVGKDAKLTIDEEKLANADFDKVKKLFNGTDSIAYKTSQDAFAVGQSAVREATLTGLNYSRSWYI